MHRCVASSVDKMCVHSRWTWVSTNVGQIPLCEKKNCTAMQLWYVTLKKCARCVCVDDDDDHARYHQRKCWLICTSSTFFGSSIFKYEIESFLLLLLIAINQNRSHYRSLARCDRNFLYIRDETKKEEAFQLNEWNFNLCQILSLTFISLMISAKDTNHI
jgi:hypothetical protein